jgi:hypothetical protein
MNALGLHRMFTVFSIICAMSETYGCMLLVLSSAEGRDAPRAESMS